MSESKVSGDKSITAKPTKSAIFKRLVNFAIPESGRIVIGLTALVVNSLTNLSFPWIMGHAVDRTSTESVDIHFIAGTAGVFLLGSLASWVRVYCLNTATERISSRLRKTLFNSYMEKDMDFFDSRKKGELLAVLENDVGSTAEALTDKLAAGLRSINSSLNGSILLFRTSPSLFSVSICILPLVGAGAMTMSKRAKRFAEKLRKVRGDVISFTIERLTSITTVRLNGRESFEKNTFCDQMDECYSLSQQSSMSQGAFMAFINATTNLSLVAVLYYGGRLMAKGQMTAGDLTKFAIQSAFVGLGFSGLSTFYSDMTKSLDAASRVFDAMDKSNGGEGVEVSTSSSSPAIGSAVVVGSIPNEGVVFRDVSFAYPSRPDALILSRFSLEVGPRALTVVAGRSGAGKSTLMAVLAGLYTALEGEVFVNGENLTSANRETIRSKVGVVEQQAGLLSGSIASNISYGKEGATLDEIRRAAVQADAHDFISALPDGYDTKLGEGNRSLLSGGQQARIALARALIRDPDCLLLDEATAALDRASEIGVIATLLKLAATKTILVFSHSEAVMRAAHVVHVLADGAVAASGSVDSLRNCKAFNDVFSSP